MAGVGRIPLNPLRRSIHRGLTWRSFLKRDLQEARSQERLVIGLSIVADNTPPKHWFLHRIGHQPRQNDRNKQQPTFHPIQVATKEQRLEPMAGCEFRPFDSN
jgi:hypothetical protein